MAMTIRTDGMEDVNKMLASLGEKATEIASKGLYDGAGIVADSMKNGINRIVTEPFNYIASSDATGTKRYASPDEKAALIGKSGIAKFQNTGAEVNTLVGIGSAAGYATVGGKKKAVRLIARSINSGTSFMHKQPVFRQAVTSSTAAAQAAIAAKIEQMINEISGGK